MDNTHLLSLGPFIARQAVTTSTQARLADRLAGPCRLRVTVP